MTAHKLTVAYVGTNYNGWQRQDEKVTIQGALEEAVAKIWNQEIHVEGSGRTDAGVHAIGQTAAFFATKKLDEKALRRAFNNHLPFDISVQKVEFMEPAFHARFDVSEKTYEYVILSAPFLDPFQLNRVWHIPHSLDLDRMREGASTLLGEYDFAAFATNSGTPRMSTIRDVRKLDIQKKGQKILIRATADGFLYHMVRNIIGALVNVGKGKLGSKQLKEILQSKRRELAPIAAPAYGLYLRQVRYFPKAIRVERAREREERRGEWKLGIRN